MSCKEEISKERRKKREGDGRGRGVFEGWKEMEMERLKVVGKW